MKPCHPFATDEAEVIAHRGASSEAPENTLAAVELAWKQGARSVEIDIRQTADGELVVIHDADTRRTTGIPGKIDQMTLSDLRLLEAGSWKDPQFIHEKIPTLDEILATAQPEGRFFIEIKSGDISLPALKASIDRAGLQAGQVVFISFHLELLIEVKRLLGEHLALLLIDRHPRHHHLGPRTFSGPDLIRLAGETGFDGFGLCADWPLDAALVRSFHDAGLNLFVWTVNEIEDAEKLIQAGVRVIASDRFRWMTDRLAEKR